MRRKKKPERDISGIYWGGKLTRHDMTVLAGFFGFVDCWEFQDFMVSQQDKANKEKLAR